MTDWKLLKKGDIIDVIAPGYGASPADIPKAEAFIKRLGFTPRIPRNIFAPHLLHSQEDEYRLKHLYSALTATDSKAVWCFKGGYGTAKLIGSLAKKAKPKTSKALIGFSDITALHLFLNQEWEWPTLHGPVLWQAIHSKVNDASIQALSNALTKKKALDYKLKPMNKAAAKASLKGTVVGGNLALLQTSVGTNWQVDAKNGFLFIEEVDEAAYRIDRMLHHLMQAGLLKGVRAILFGDFTYKEKFEEEIKIAKVLKTFAEGIAIPAYRLNNIGHAEDNFPLPMGSGAKIAGTTLKVESGGV